MQPQLLQVETPLERASCWFINSGIQEAEGGVARYYQTDLESNAPISTEITGYTVSGLAYAFRRTGNRQCLDRAVAAGRFLTEKAWDRDVRSFPFELADAGRPLKAYFFDCGIIVRGLLALWRETDDSGYLEAARQGGLAMRDFQSSSVIHPVLYLPTKEPAPYQTAWSRSPGCYQLKSAMAWYDLAAATGEEQFRADYFRAVEAAIETHESFLPAPDGPEKTMDRLHAYCYFMEGLLPIADRTDTADTLRDGIANVSAFLREIEPTFVRSDVYAQLLRLRLYAESLAGVPVSESELTEEVTRMTAFQSFDDDDRRRGGFYFGRKNDSLLPYVNPVSTAFCMQALDLCSGYRAGEFDADTRSLI